MNEHEGSSAGSYVGGFILLITRVALGAAFLLAAWVKLTDVQEFSGSIQTFNVLPKHMVGTAAYAIPWIEGVAAVALIVGLWPRAAALTLIGLLAGFTGLILSAIFRDMTVNCGCFGKLDLVCSGPLDWCNIAQNSVLVLLGLPTLIWGGGVFSVQRALDREPDPVPA